MQPGKGAPVCVYAGHRGAPATCTPLIEASASYPPLIYSLEGRNERPRREANNYGYGLAVIVSIGSERMSTITSCL